MLSRLIAAALLIGLGACAGGASSPSYVSTASTTIDCAASYITVDTPGDYACAQYERTTATANDNGQSMFQTFTVSGTTADQLIVSAQVHKALSRGYIASTAASDAAYRGDIQNYNATTRDGRAWSKVSNLDGARVLTFSDGEQRRCFGFLTFGGLAYQGYSYYTRGYFCRRASGLGDFAEDEMRSLVKRIVVRDRI